MIEQAVILALVSAQRLGELVLAKRNTTALIKQGGIEYANRHFPLIVALHGAWLLGLWIVALDHTVGWYWLGVFVSLQGFRAWILVTLGKRWTARIIVVPGEVLVTKGPYRVLRHPNYVLVWCEIIVLPLVFGLIGYAALFGALNTVVLWWRIRAENVALATVQA